MLRIHPSDAIVCFHGQPSAAFIPFYPRRSAWFSRFQTLEQISSHTTNAGHTHTHNSFPQHSSDTHTSAALRLDIRLRSLSLHGEMGSKDKCCHCSHVHWPWNIPTLPCGLSLLSHFIVFLLPFVHVSFCPPCCFVALCPSCFFLWMTTVKAGKNDPDRRYLTFITWFVGYP